MAKCTLSPYDGRTEEIREKLFRDMPSYEVNRRYRYQNDFYFYVNRRGYIHICKPERISIFGMNYWMVDYLLTKNGKLKKSSSGRFFETLEELITSYETEHMS